MPPQGIMTCKQAYLVGYYREVFFFLIETQLVGQALSTFCNRCKNEPNILGLCAKKKAKVFQSTAGNLMETELQFTQLRIFTSETL